MWLGLETAPITLDRALYSEIPMSWNHVVFFENEIVAQMRFKTGRRKSPDIVLLD
jgi:hypothetical protein